MSEKYGIVMSSPLTCGTCSKVGHETYMRWCAACGEGICPTCFPASENATLGRCARCVAENRKTRLELAGEQMAMEREERFLAAFMKDMPIATLPQGEEYIPPQMPSSLVHVHEDLYVDAANVVSVQAFQNNIGLSSFWIVLREGNGQFAKYVFVTKSLDDAQQFAREIVERVNAGRWTHYKVHDREIPISLGELQHRLAKGEDATVRQLWSGGGIAKCSCFYTTREETEKARASGTHHPGCPKGKTAMETKASDEVFRAKPVDGKIEFNCFYPASNTSTARVAAKCTCPTDTLMASGCQCGAMK